jgi:hypothetical protein
MVTVSAMLVETRAAVVVLPASVVKVEALPAISAAMAKAAKVLIASAVLAETAARVLMASVVKAEAVPAASVVLVEKAKTLPLLLSLVLLVAEVAVQMLLAALAMIGGCQQVTISGRRW